MHFGAVTPFALRTLGERIAATDALATFNRIPGGFSYERTATAPQMLIQRASVNGLPPPALRDYWRPMGGNVVPIAGSL